MGTAELLGRDGSRRLPSSPVSCCPPRARSPAGARAAPSTAGEALQSPRRSPTVAGVTGSAGLQAQREPRGWRSPRRGQRRAAPTTAWASLCLLTLKPKLLCVCSHEKPKTFCPGFPSTETSLGKIKLCSEVSCVEGLLSLPSGFLRTRSAKLIGRDPDSPDASPGKVRRPWWVPSPCWPS